MSIYSRARYGRLQRPGAPMINAMPPMGNPSAVTQAQAGPAIVPTSPTSAATYSPFGTDQNLIGTQIIPTTPGDTSAARAAVGQQLGALQTGPDRGALAAQTYQQLADLSAPQYATDLRNVGRKAATLGRIGAGITTTELGDVTSNREKYLGNLKAQLATGAAGQTLQDRLNTFGASQSGLSQLTGLDEATRAELRGERGYQEGLSQQAFGNNLAENDLLASLGGFNPSGATGAALANQYGAQGESNLAGGASLLDYIMRLKKRSPYAAVDYGSGGDTSTFGAGFGLATPGEPW